MKRRNYIILDLEATCWRKGTRPARMEIIEFGAVMLAAPSMAVIDEFSCFVRPVNEPELSEFCTELTSITQHDVDGADTFPTVLENFLKWIGPGHFTLCSWGAYDLRQLIVDCERHSIPFPKSLKNHINLKKTFCDLKRIKPCGMKRALRILGIPLEGKHHRGIDDARNIVKIAQVILSMHR